MGPTNVALVKLYQADQQLRAAQERLNSASKNVRVIERRAAELAEKLKLVQATLREHQGKAADFDLDLKTRDTHIDKLRTQQQSAKNNKEYQTFLSEIAAQKIDRNKVEEQVLAEMEQVERLSIEVADLQKQYEGEQTKAAQTRAALSSKLAELQGQVDRIQPVRDAAAAAVPKTALNAFERMVEKYDGEAMASLGKPSRRVEEYICNGCNMALVVDIYNRLHTRDEVVFCPSCARILYIPDELPPEMAINTRGKSERGEKLASK